MKYYIGKILERNGDFEYTDMYLFKTKGDPDKFAERTAGSWRHTTDWDSAHEGYWCDHTLIFNEGYTEITEDEFVVLNKFIPAISGFQGETE
jgi:hypothetical protein